MTPRRKEKLKKAIGGLQIRKDLKTILFELVVEVEETWEGTVRSLKKKLKEEKQKTVPTKGPRRGKKQ